MFLYVLQNLWMFPQILWMFLQNLRTPFSAESVIIPQCSQQYVLCQKQMILFLNKKDLFEEKIKKLSLNILFLSYGGKLKNNIYVT
uniref:Uncharacterized protein n=1 Tax=Meloidogyne incognita TaxID=6306 RepID=A0A914L2F8_MELIC